MNNEKKIDGSLAAWLNGFVDSDNLDKPAKREVKTNPGNVIEEGDVVSLKSGSQGMVVGKLSDDGMIAIVFWETESGGNLPGFVIARDVIPTCALELKTGEDYE